MSIRDLVVHMIEEYARHCGHADLLREMHRRQDRPVSEPRDELGTLRLWLTRTSEPRSSARRRAWTPEQLARPVGAAVDLSVLGLVRHLAQMEHHWFVRVLSRSGRPSRSCTCPTATGTRSSRRRRRRGRVVEEAFDDLALSRARDADAVMDGLPNDAWSS